LTCIFLVWYDPRIPMLPAKRGLVVFALAAAAALTPVAFGLDGQVGIHDPSTIVQCDGKYYTYGTGGTGLVSDDGWTWRRGATLPVRGLAPDVIHIGDRYYVYTATSVGGQPHAQMHMIWSKTLDPNSPDYKWEEGGIVASSDGIEESNAIDPGVFLDHKTGRLWLTDGSYFGYIRLVELDPKTGKRLNPNVPPRDLAINGEASDLMYHDGWYYLLDTHGSCCRGADSGYNIRVGRSRTVTGPYLDNDGKDMLLGGGYMLIGSGDRKIGPGHFGLLDVGDGVQKFSMHWEADLDKGGASVLDIRPLLWKDGWPVAGEKAREGTYNIQAVDTATSLELDVEGIPVGGRPNRGPRPAGGARPAGAAAPGPGAPHPAGAPGAAAGGPGGPGGGGGLFAGTGGVIPNQEAAQVSANWPSGNINVRMGNYLLQAQQKWTITPVAGAGGYPGSPYFKITIAGTDRTLAVSPDADLITVPAFNNAPEQLLRLDQLSDGSWRIMPKAVPGSTQALALTALGSSFATLEKFDPKNVKQRWLLKTP
jgi:arabinan endo-1,5-alpha-L-arabinosidase